MSSKKIVLGVVAAAAASVVAGVLLAPAKGSVTRKKMIRKGKAFVEDAKEKLDDYTDGMTKEFKSVKKSAKELVSEGKRKQHL